MRPGSRRWGAAGGGRGASAGREAGASLLAARGIWGAGASALRAAQLGKAASGPSPGGACLWAAGTDALPPATEPRVSLPRGGPEALCKEAGEAWRVLFLIKSFYKSALLEIFAEFEVLYLFASFILLLESFFFSAVNVFTIGADQGWTFCNWNCNSSRRDSSQDGQKVLWNGAGWN